MFLVRHCSESAVSRLDCTNPTFKANCKSEAVGRELSTEEKYWRNNDYPQATKNGRCQPRYFDYENISDLSTDAPSSEFSSPKQFLYSSLNTYYSDSICSNCLSLGSPEAEEESLSMEKHDGHHSQHTRSDRRRTLNQYLHSSSSQFERRPKSSSCMGTEAFAPIEEHDEGSTSNPDNPKYLDETFFVETSELLSLLEEASTLDEDVSKRLNSDIRQTPEIDTDDLSKTGKSDSSKEEHHSLLSMTPPRKKLIAEYLRARNAQFTRDQKTKSPCLGPDEELLDRTPSHCPSRKFTEHANSSGSETSKLISDFLRRRDAIKCKESTTKCHQREVEHGQLEAEALKCADDDKVDPSLDSSIDYSHVVAQFLKDKGFVNTDCQNAQRKISDISTRIGATSPTKIVSPLSYVSSPPGGEHEQSEQAGGGGRNRKNNAAIPGFQLISPSTLGSESVFYRRNNFNSQDISVEGDLGEKLKETEREDSAFASNLIQDKIIDPYQYYDEEQRGCGQTVLPKGFERLMCSKAANRYFPSVSNGSFLI